MCSLWWNIHPFQQQSSATDFFARFRTCLVHCSSVLSNDAAVYTFSLLGPAVFLLSLSLVTSYSGVLLCMAGAICCCGFHTSGILLNPQDIAPQYGGAVFGLMNMAGAIPGFIGVYVTGYILETTKSWTIVFTQTSAFCIIGWIIYLAFGTAQKLV